MSELIANMPPWPQGDFAEFGKVEVRPIGRIQQLTARFLGRNWVSIPHVTHHDELDITELEERRLAWNAASSESKYTPLIPLIKALVATLTDHPQFNTSLDPSGKTLIEKQFFHIGVATDTPNGLLVPVLRDCDKKSLAELAAELKLLAEKARTKGLSLPEMSGGSITISSLGHIGGTGFTPIVNAPEVAVLGVTKIQTRAAQNTDGGIAWRRMLPVSLSYDHRVINGADAARFVVTLGDYLTRFEFDR